MFFQCTSGKWSSEISSQKWILFGKSEAKYWTESPNRFLKNSEKESLFEPLFGNKTLKDLCDIIAFGWYVSLRNELFWCKMVKIEWFLRVFLWDSAHKPRIHLFRSFSTFDLRHYRLYVWKPCVFCVFSRIFRAFWETWLDSRISLEGGPYRGEVNIDRLPIWKSDIILILVRIWSNS